MEYVIGQKVFMLNKATDYESIGTIIAFEDSVIDGKQLEDYYAKAYFPDLDRTALIRNDVGLHGHGAAFYGPLWKSESIRDKLQTFYEENELGSGLEMKHVMPLCYTSDGEDGEVQVFIDLFFNRIGVMYENEVIYTKPFDGLYDIETYTFNDFVDAALCHVYEYKPKAVILSSIKRKFMAQYGGNFVLIQADFTIDNAVHLIGMYVVNSEFGCYIVDPNEVANIETNVHANLVNALLSV